MGRIEWTRHGLHAKLPFQRSRPSAEGVSELHLGKRPADPSNRALAKKRGAIATLNGGSCRPTRRSMCPPAHLVACCSPELGGCRHLTLSIVSQLVILYGDICAASAWTPIHAISSG